MPKAGQKCCVSCSTINVAFESATLCNLAPKIAGRVIHYNGQQISSPKMLEFIRRKFPYKLVDNVNDLNIEQFLDGWIDNRVRALIFSKGETVRLRFMTTAFKFKARAQVGGCVIK